MIKFCLIILLSLPSALADNSDDGNTDVPETTFSERFFTLYFHPGFASISNSGNNLSGIDLGVGALFGLSDSWAVGGELNQAIDQSGFDTLYTEFAAQIVYSVWGSHIRRKRITHLNSVQMVERDEYPSGGLFISAGVKQFFFNASEQVIALTGPGFSAFYRFPTQKTLNWIVGVGYDSAKNGSNSVTTMKFFTGFNFWL